MNEIAKIEYDEIDTLLDEARRIAGVVKMLKFKKGDYYCDNVEIARGTQMVAHIWGWVRQWVKFVDRRPVERHTYHIMKKEHAPDRSQMPDWDAEGMRGWPIVDGKPQDPWSLQNILPMENFETGERYIFVSATVGGGKAIGELIEAYGLKRRGNRTLGLPLIRLQKTMMPAGQWGPQVRPLFEITGYDTREDGEQIKDISPDTLSKVDADMNDEIPF